MSTDTRLMVMLFTQEVSALRHPKSVRVSTERFGQRVEAKGTRASYNELSFKWLW